MGYTRRGSKFTNHFSLYCGTPGFCSKAQITAAARGHQDSALDLRKIFFFLFCGWKAAWSICYKPINETERITILLILGFLLEHIVLSKK
ncbi:Oidioi.mRNA.OKI2018_I69.PAR.g11613.t1.cds [Oikopleura dioica]|uniref:Oidioi.mRNA.OKI2018_I69.PAR.g11613.t1.cds n=1 Tax=Oikopleura dioica TaxID=34765 RepID=A0ABN7RX92_OIKDI|nr:Oidioi.mRNA.OKI2018_I69.PAR.g11613.t1.cds [Oikopleura dioica]